MVFLATLLVAGLACTGHAHHFIADDPAQLGAFPLDAASLRAVAGHDLDAHLMGAAALGEGPNCSVTCNGDEFGALDGKNKTGGKGVDCWGTFKAFCKGGSEKVVGFGGFSCEGHFVGFKAPCGTKIGVCAGETKKFAKAFIKTESGRVKVFKAGGGIGTSGVAIAAPNLTLPSHIEWPSSLAAVQGLAELYEGKLHPHGAKHHGEKHGAEPLLEGGPHTLKKAFGDGAGGGLIAVKKLSAEDAAKWDAKHAKGKHGKDMTFEKLADKAERKLAKLGVRLPVEPSLFNVDASSAVEGADCAVTCNGKPAWFKGGFPCIGELKVVCAIETEDHADTLILKKAGCKGFWSGVFGKKCSGFSYDKTAIKAIGQFAYCSGKKGIFMKKKEGGFVAGGSCFGKGLYAVQYTPESSTAELSA